MAQGIGTSIFSAAKAGQSIAGSAERITFGSRTDVVSATGHPSFNLPAGGTHFNTFFDTGVVDILPNGRSDKKLRLNINLHGYHNAIGQLAQAQAWYIWTEVRRLHPTQLLNNIKGIRLISCYGGELGNVGEYLASISGKNVKSYIGPVTVAAYTPQALTPAELLVTKSERANGSWIGDNITKPYRKTGRNNPKNLLSPGHYYQVRMVAPGGWQMAHYHYVNGNKVYLP